MVCIKRFSMGYLSNRSDRRKLIFLGLTCFAGAAIGGSYYDKVRDDRIKRDILNVQLNSQIWDSTKRQFVTSTADGSQNGSANVSKLDLKSEGAVTGYDKIPIDKINQMEVSKRVTGAVILPDNVKITLFQYQSCPFCCKVRSFLDYYGLPYDVIEVNPVLRQQLKIFEYKKVPTLVIHKKKNKSAGNVSNDGQEDIRIIDEPIQLKDSSLIISMLASFLFCNPNLQDNLNAISSMYPSLAFASLEEKRAVSTVVNKYFIMKGDNLSPAEYKVVVKALSEERKWREWTDSVLVHTLSPNVYRTWSEAVETFKYFSFVAEWERIFKPWERQLVIYGGAAAMFMIGKRLKKKYQLKKDVRESLYDAVRHWLKSLPKGCKYMGGSQANLADLAVFGVMSSIEGTEAFSDLLQKVPDFMTWYLNVKKDVYEKAGAKEVMQVLKAVK